MTGQCTVDGCTRKARNGRDADLCKLHYDHRRKAALAALRAGQPCTMCGSLHLTPKGGRACYGHQPRTLKPCTKPPIDGLEVCQTHGGANSNARRAGEQRMAEQEAVKTLAQYIVEGDDRDPGVILLERISVASGLARFYQQQTLTLSNEDHIWGRSKDVTGGKDAGTTYEAKPHMWVVLWEKWEAKLHALCVDALKVGLKQRELDIAQSYAGAWATAIEGIVRALGHNPADPETAEVIVRHLRVVGD